MRKQKYPLDTLLRLRLHDRGRRTEELAAAHHADDELLQQSHAVSVQQHLAVAQRRHAAAPGTLDVALLLQQNRHEAALQADAQRLQISRAEQLAETERRRAALTEADRAAKTLEKLRDKHLLQQREEQLRQENRAIM